MRYLAIGIYVAAVIGLCAALPIRSAALGERNAFIFGALIFLSFGAVLAGCVCCKRRKKGFEEFKNESGTLESNKTEYPIFRALSPESQRSIPAANVNASAVNNSNENLIVDDIDNNNGPISPADLENIENNNAVDYIQNQNEIGLVIEPSPYSINRNLIDSQQVELEQHSDEELLQDVAISSTTDSYAARSSSSATTRNSSSTTAISQNSLTSCSSNAVTCLANIEIYPFDNNKLDDADDDDDVDNIDDDIIVKQQIIVQENVPIVNADCTTNRQIELLRHHDESNDSRTTVIDIECMPNDNIRNIQITPEKEYTTLPEETTSIKSISSDKSHEGNSVEEALRALDNAIEAEELNDIDDDEDDLPDEDFGEDATNFQNVIRQLLINNGINGILPNLTTIVPDQVNENSLTIVNDDKVDNKNLENIRAEAAILVDSILNESQQIAEEKREHLKHNIETTFQIYSVPECSFEHNNNNKSDMNLLEFSATDITSNLDTKPKTDINSPFLEETDSFKSTEDLFSGEMLAKTSTPCIHNKFSTAPHSDQHNKISHNLFGGDVEDDLMHTSSRILQNDVMSPTAADNVTFTSPPFVNQTFDADKTYDINERDENQTEFTYPGDPCTSKQALERDYGYPIIKCERDDGNSEDLTTITPVNTPIELNYPHDTWDKMTKATNEAHMNDDHGDPQLKSGWFLHPQANAELNNETFDAEDETNLELTFEALRKQLAEVLPQHQGMTGPPEYSDEEDDPQNNRTFDEYRSPLDGLVGLLECDSSAPVVASNEVFINYKRSLSPIIEESEEETCKTFILNETKCLDSTRNRRIISENKRRRNRELFTSRTGCVDTGEAIMGVTKTLMASNDTLFNFEDTLGDKEDVFSPRIPSRNESQATTPIKNYKSIEDNSLGTSESDTERGCCGGRNPTPTDLDINQQQQGRKSPPKTIDFVSCSELKADSDLCSPDQQKTFSEGTSTSTTTDRLSSDISPTLDHDTTFTTNTMDEKTCITVIIKDDERISEISEPDWGSTASCGPYDVNSLTDIPSLDFNVNTFDKHFEKESIIKPEIELEEKTSLEDDDVENVDDDIDDNDDEEEEEVENIESSTDNNIHNNDIERDSGHDDSGHSTQASTDEKSTSNNMSAQEAQSLVENEMNLTNLSTPSNINTNLEIKQNCTQFLINEIEISSSQSLKDKKLPQHLQQQQQQQQQQQYNQVIRIDSGDVEGSKENTDPNVKLYSNSFENDKISYQKVQMNSQDAVILEKSKNTTSSDFMEKDLTNGVHDNNMFHQSDITILPSKHHQHTITSYSVNDVDGIHNEQNCLMVADEIIGHLSGEEDPWVESVNDIRYSGPCTEMISTSFNINEWDSDVDDSHSSEEFMYVRGTPTRDELLKINRSDEITDSDRQFSNTTDGTYDSNIWSSHEDKVPAGVRHLAEEEVSEESSSEFEGEFIPSCWDSMAMPARSALKSPDKSSSENKKRRSVAFKNQRYHSVYEYPRENTSLSPAYSEPFLWNKLSESSLLDEKDQMEEFSDGFTVSSSMRPFHGSQFNVLCHTWPTDSDFSWSQVEDLSNIVEDKPLATYSNIEIKWPQNFTNVTNNEDTATENIKIDENKRPDSGVGASAEMLSDRTSLGELRHTKAALRLPLEHIPPVEPPPPEPKPEIKENDSVFPESLILPTPSCTGSMDSLSSSSSSERQVSFTTFGKRNSFNENDKRINFDFNNQLRPALILIDGEPLDSNCLKPEKIKQSDSTDEDSGIESIMKVNKESD